VNENKNNKESLLIVDDEIVIRRLLYGKLVAEGYTCYEASNAEEVMLAMCKYQPSLVILDIKMPGKSGVEILSDIKQKYPDTAVIMATAITDMNTAINCMKKGAYDYFSKPFNLEEVSIGVNRALEKRRLEINNREYRKNLEEKVKEQAEKIRSSFLNAITSLAYALEAKDKYTSGHSRRVAEWSVKIARESGLSADYIEKVRLAGQVHDIGKIGIRSCILLKSEGLTEEEYRYIKSHPEVGERILTPIIEDKMIIEMVRHHHERYDGKGYPDGLKGEQIPLGARILAVADSYDAITSERPYRRAMKKEKALEEIKRCKGSQFDPKVVESFIKISESERAFSKSTV